MNFINYLACDGLTLWDDINAASQSRFRLKGVNREDVSTQKDLMNLACISLSEL